MSLSRLRTNFRFAILTLFGAVGVLGVTPFALYRFVHGQVLIGLVDLGIVACIAACLAYVWRGGNLERASWFVVATYNLGCLMIAGLIGLSGVLWMYPVLLANFLLVDRWIAIGVSAVGIAAVLLLPDVFASGLQLALFLITAVITCLFTFIFAARGDSQRARLEALARLDPLTQAFNRRALERELQLALESHRRRQSSFGLAVLDLDHFKRVNDTFGHEAGDRVLVEFTRLVGAVTRKGDRLFRSGGEEFVLLLPGAGVAELQIVCEHVRARVAAGLACDGQSITVSIGAAALVTGEDALSWLGRADAAMYRAKNAGRNAVVVDPAGDSPTLASATAR